VICIGLCGCGSRPASRELANVAPPSEPAKVDPLALAKGATFRYEVAIDAGAGVRRFPWTMTVVDVVERNGVTLYKISGWPQQLVDFDPATVPTPKLRNLINANDNYVWADDVANVAGTRWFTWPLFDGQRICPDPNIRYCWTVSVERGRYSLRMVTDRKSVV